MLQSSCAEMNPGKYPVNRPCKVRDMDLRQMHIYLLGSMYAGNWALINNRQF